MEAKLSRHAAELMEYGQPIVLVNGGPPRSLRTPLELAAHHKGRPTEIQSELALR